LLSEIEPDRKWDLSHRTYTERHDKNTLSQTFFKALLLDPSVFVKYNENDDNLYVILYFKNPSGRILRKKWTSDWKVIQKKYIRNHAKTHLFLIIIHHYFF
jgi:hypothetical protein